MSDPETMLDEPAAGLSPAEIWGERAQQLVDYVKSQKPPVVKKASVHVFATRKGWEAPTLAGILQYCIEHKLLVAYQAVSGPAFKIPLTRVFDMADEELPPPGPEPEVPALAALAARREQARVSLGARVDQPKKEKKPMSKDWISTAEAAELIGCTKHSAIRMAYEKKVEAKQEGDGARAPFVFKRTSVIAYRDARKTGEATKAPPQRKQTAIVVAREAKAPVKVKKAAPKPSVTSPKAQVVAGDLADDVRALLHNVKRGWMTADAMLTHLAELVA